MSGDEPGFVVAVGKLDERGAQFFDGIEGSDPEQGNLALKRVWRKAPHANRIEAKSKAGQVQPIK